MNKLNLHNACKKLCWQTYQEGKNKNADGWQYVNSYSHRRSGYYSEVYRKGEDVILVIKGTDLNSINEFRKDGYSDIQMGLRMLPDQMPEAEKSYIRLVQAYGKDHVIVSGHSLGGSEAQIIGAKYGAETITFGAYGTKNIHGVEINNTENITNYGNAQDGIFVDNIDNQIGKTMILNTTKTKNESFTKGYSYHGLAPHYIQNYGDLSQGVEYKKEVFEDENAPLFKLGIEYNDYNPDEVFDTKNRVLYQGELDLKDLEEGTPLYDLYMDNITDKNPMPTKKEVDKRTRIGELIYVEEYTRSDGTKVSGYYRTYPRK